jgi:multicomponent Na+:H+ antiporter subunit D
VTTLLVLPVALPLATAALSMVLWRSLLLQRILGITGGFALLAVAIALLVGVDRLGPVAVQLGGWPAPFGITLVADLFSAIMVLLAGVIGAATFVYSAASVDTARQSFFYYPLLHILLAGVCGAFLTGDLFNLFVWFEVLLISSFVLMALGNERAQLEGALKYVTLNLVSSILFLMAVGLLYGLVGTLNMADLSIRLRQADRPGVVTAVSMLLLTSFGIKSAVFPLFSWLPASYHAPPFAISAIFAGLLTKVGVYAMIRVFTLLFTDDVEYTHTIILAIAGLTMVTGVLGAAAQNEFRRILSFHIISQVGYMILGLALFSTLALAGSVFYIAHHIIVKANLFFISGVVHRLRETSDLGRPGAIGVYAASPIIAMLFLVPAMSLAGMPPFSGFFAKLILARAGFEQGEYLIVAIALLVGLLTLFSMTKIWAAAFWKGPEADDSNHAGPPDEPRNQPPRRPIPFGMLAPVIALALLTVLIGAAAGPVFDLSMRAAEQLMDPTVYQRAVFGEAP